MRTNEHVVVLGLGRMGSAMLARLHERGHSVIGWSRTPKGGLGALPTETELRAAAGKAGIVLLCLFDAEACADVLASAGDSLKGTTVVNTATVSGVQAEELARLTEELEAHYVHAPVLGSVQAVARGTLTILTGGGVEPASEAVLADLGTVIPCESVADAAAAKLLVNGSLAKALLAIGDGHSAGAEMGLRAAQIWDVLELSPLGRIVQAKRERLDKQRFEDADFTVDALLKDVRLLSEAAPSALPTAKTLNTALRSGAVAASDDVSALCFVGCSETQLEHGLRIAPEIEVPPEVLAPLRAYVAGHATGDASHHRRAFLASAHIEGIREGRFHSWNLDEYCAVFTGRPADDEASRQRRIESVTVSGSVATAVMTLRHGPNTFTDMFLLVRAGERWSIANKAYHRAPTA